MRRGDVYLIEQAGAGGVQQQRLFVVISRQLAIDSALATVICAPVFHSYDGLATQIQVGAADGLPYDGSIHCEALVSLPKAALSRLIGRLGAAKLKAVEKALTVALDLPAAE